jgi:hypothetical protein
VPLLRERALVLRAAFAAPVEPAVFLRVPVALRAPEEAVEPLFADVARLDADFFAAALGLEAVLRDVAARELAFLAVERVPLDLRPPVDRVDALLPLAEPPPPLEVAVALHFPDITRCAASATASAISEPSLVALAAMLVAAFDAVSAASSPASRIFLRAAGLAAIAAAAAVRPAASISLLIAALASLSTVLSLEPDRDDDEPERVLVELEREELLRGDFAIFSLPGRGKDTSRLFRFPNEAATACPAQLENVKGTAAFAAMPFDMVSGRRCGRSSARQSERTPLSDLPAEP